MGSVTTERAPPLSREELSPEEAAVHDRFSGYTKWAYGPSGDAFVYKDTRGALLGVFPYFRHYPEVALFHGDVAKQIKTIPIPAVARDIATLAVAAHFKSVSEIDGCGRRFIKDQILTPEQVETIVAGKKPTDLSKAAAAAYDLGKYLVSTRGPLPQELWDACVRDIGKEGTIGCVHFIGFYVWACVVVNAIDVPCPPAPTGVPAK